jgi:hypothetical protein
MAAAIPFSNSKRLICVSEYVKNEYNKKLQGRSLYRDDPAFFFLN